MDSKEIITAFSNMFSVSCDCSCDVCKASREHAKKALAALSTIDPEAIRRETKRACMLAADEWAISQLAIRSQREALGASILGAEPAQDDGKAEMGDLVAWDALKKLAEEQFEVRAKHAREGKQAGIEAGDTSEVQCFACELQILNRGYDAWQMAYHLMRAAEVKRKIEEAGE